MILRNCTEGEFIDNLNGRKVICFGAGSSLVEREQGKGQFEHLEEHIAFLVDNEVSKIGQKYEYRNHIYDIKGVEALKQIDVKQYVLMITCMYYVEIWIQLKDIAEIRDLECYAYHLMWFAPEVDIERYLTIECEKKPYKEWKQILHSLDLKDKHKGQRCFVVGNGPSLNAQDLECLKNEISFGVNRIFLMFEKTSWRPTYYCCMDYDNYSSDHKRISEIESELRFVPIERAMAAGKVYDEITYYHQKSNITQIEAGNCLINADCKFSCDFEDVIYGGRTVLYDVLQIAVYMGFSEIYLIGVDHTYSIEELENGRVCQKDCNDYFDKEYLKYDSNTSSLSVPVYAMSHSFQCAKEVCESKGIIIKNATRGGRLEVFERVNFDSLFQKESG